MTPSLWASTTSPQISPATSHSALRNALTTKSSPAILAASSESSRRVFSVTRPGPVPSMILWLWVMLSIPDTPGSSILLPPPNPYPKWGIITPSVTLRSQLMTSRFTCTGVPLLVSPSSTVFS